jgi:hypothetical protein
MVLCGELFEAREQFALALRLGCFQVRFPIADDLGDTSAILRRREVGTHAERLRIGSYERCLDRATYDCDGLSAWRGRLHWLIVFRRRARKKKGP